jgi:hypothetical protein
MRIILNIGLPHTGTEALQSALHAARGRLAGRQVLYAKSPGDTNHTRLFLAATDPDHVDPLRFNRGLGLGKRQAGLRDSLIAALKTEVAEAGADCLILSCWQLCGLTRRSELERLRDMLVGISPHIDVVIHVADPAQVALHHYAAQLSEGRAVPLSAELDLVDSANWWEAAIAGAGEIDPARGLFEETGGPVPWLDYQGLADHWAAVFGAEALRFVAAPEDVAGGIADAFGLTLDTDGLDIEETIRLERLPSPASLARARQFNTLLLPFIKATGHVIPRPLWRQMTAELALPGAAATADGLARISERFGASNAELAARHGLPDDLFPPAQAGGADWQEADPDRGFRASSYLLHFRWRIEKVAKEIGKAGKPAARAALPDLSDTAKAIMPERAQENYETLRTSRFAPRNDIGQTIEDVSGQAYEPMAPRDLPEGQSGRVIVGCMKNEAPYILEWVAYHRAIGIDNFLIYTNGCEDGTDELLDRLQELGLLQHRLNDDWRGKSPQQFALNRALEEPVIRNAEWLIHIDVDEFMNVRCGNGTLDDFFERVPDATNVAMTWRLFGNCGVTALDDRPVIGQFDHCAPKFCPKPHTVWGFKSMVRNTGAYAKLSCHRPNKLDPERRNQVKWVNGSGADITGEVAEKGWRSSMKSIGYDLLQLNHYALRSAESFLIKRQRGRALHVDRSIGLNYWIRMDWSDHPDLTIQRNLPRVQAEIDRLVPHEMAMSDGFFAVVRALRERRQATPESCTMHAL